MDSLVFALNATLPIVLTVAIGYILKRIGLMSREFADKANKLVFKVFLPVMLFLNVYSIEDLTAVNFDYILYSIILIVLIFLIGIPIAAAITKKGERRGVLLQAFFRSNNAIIGVSLATLLFGAAGAIYASILSAAVVPIFNILGVVALAMFKKDGEISEEGGTRVASQIKKVLLAIVKNPLIISILLGFVALGIRMILVECNIDFRLKNVDAIYKTLEYLGNLATPLALVALGGQFEFSTISELKREIISGVLMRILIVPAVTLTVAYLLFGTSFNGGVYAALIAAFCTPVAVSTVPMAQEMGGDTSLAGQLVLFSTLASSVTIFAASFILSALGVFA